MKRDAVESPCNFHEAMFFLQFSYPLAVNLHCYDRLLSSQFLFSAKYTMEFVTSALSVLLLSIISSTAAESSLSQHSKVYPRELDLYDPSQYIARTGHSSMFFQLSCTMKHVVDILVAIVVGNYLYIDGGEVYINDSGAVAAYPG